MSEALNNLGNALRVIGDKDGAMNAYQEALTYREIYPEAYNNLGTLLQQDGKMPEAEHALRKAIAQNPQYIEAYNNLANMLANEKKDVDALRLLGEALENRAEESADIADHGEDSAASQQPCGRRAGSQDGPAGTAGKCGSAYHPRSGASTKPTVTTRQSASSNRR